MLALILHLYLAKSQYNFSDEHLFEYQFLNLSMSLVLILLVLDELDSILLFFVYKDVDSKTRFIQKIKLWEIAKSLWLYQLVLIVNQIFTIQKILDKTGFFVAHNLFFYAGLSIEYSDRNRSIFVLDKTCFETQVFKYKHQLFQILFFRFNYLFEWKFKNCKKIILNITECWITI